MARWRNSYLGCQSDVTKTSFEFLSYCVESYCIWSYCNVVQKKTGTMKHAHQSNHFRVLVYPLWILLLHISTIHAYHERRNESIFALSNSHPKVIQTKPHQLRTSTQELDTTTRTSSISTLLRGGGSLLAGYNPFGYGITSLGLEFLQWEGSLDSDVGRFLATFKSGRKKKAALKDTWLEIVRVSKQGKSMRIYRNLDDLLEFCVKAGFLV